MAISWSFGSNGFSLYIYLSKLGKYSSQARTKTLQAKSSHRSWNKCSISSGFGRSSKSQSLQQGLQILTDLYRYLQQVRFCVTFEDKTRSRTSQSLSKDPFFWSQTLQTADGSRNRVPESSVPDIYLSKFGKVYI